MRRAYRQGFIAGVGELWEAVVMRRQEADPAASALLDWAMRGDLHRWVLVMGPDWPKSEVVYPPMIDRLAAAEKGE